MKCRATATALTSATRRPALQPDTAQRAFFSTCPPARRINVEEVNDFRRGCQQDAEGVWTPYDTPGAFVYGTGPQNDPAGLMNALWAIAADVALPLESMNGEFDNGQFELTMKFEGAVAACDSAFLFKTMAREVAAELGLLLTFLPKPIPDRGGSGLHVNFSFEDESGANVIAPDGTLSDVARGCMAGLIHHHEGLARLLATTVNSYDRLGPASMAGYWAN